MSALSGSFRNGCSAAIMALIICAGPAHATIHTVTVTNNQFNPSSLQINDNDTVRWIRQAGTVSHTTTSDAASTKDWDSGTLQIGVPFDVSFSTTSDGPGPFPYHCQFHSLSMKGTITVISLGVALEQSDLLPTTFEVGQNYPNPFNPTTTIQLSLERTAAVNFSVYNILGELVDQRDFGVLAPGGYTLTWDANSTDHGMLPSGVYFYRISTGGSVETRKMVLLK
jgi:plastocyanin